MPTPSSSGCTATIEGPGTSLVHSRNVVGWDGRWRSDSGAATRQNDRPAAHRGSRASLHRRHSQRLLFPLWCRLPSGSDARLREGTDLHSRLRVGRILASCGMVSRRLFGRWNVVAAKSRTGGQGAARPQGAVGMPTLDAAPYRQVGAVTPNPDSGRVIWPGAAGCGRRSRLADIIETSRV